MTPDDLTARLDAVLQGFQAYVRSTDNPFDSDSVHGVFAACSHFVREKEVQPEGWKALAEVLNEMIGGQDGELDEAACTCFLENLAQPGHPILVHLRGSALDFWRSQADPKVTMAPAAEGRFYVDPEACLTHECCVDDAPAFFALQAATLTAIVYKQPTSPDEVALVRQVMEGCPVCAIHDREDPDWPPSCREFWTHPDGRQAQDRKRRG